MAYWDGLKLPPTLYMYLACSVSYNTAKGIETPEAAGRVNISIQKEIYKLGISYQLMLTIKWQLYLFRELTTCMFLFSNEHVVENRFS